MDTVQTLLEVVANVRGLEGFDRLDSATRKAVLDFSNLQAKISSSFTVLDTFVKALDVYNNQLATGQITQAQYNKEINNMSAAVNITALPAFRAYNQAINSSEIALKKAQAPMVEFEANLAAVEKQLESYDLISAKAFGSTNEAAQIRNEIEALDEFNAKLTQVEENLANYDLIRAKAFGQTYGPTIRKDVAAAEQEGKPTGDSSHGGLFGTGVSVFAAFAAVEVIRKVADSLVEAAKATMELTQSTQLLSQELGISTQAASGWVVEAKALGIGADTVTEAYRTFADRLGRATGLFGEPTKGSKDMKRAMDELGISVYDAQGRVRSLDDILPEVADKIQGMGEGIKTTAIATALFGQRADEMLPALLRGAEGFERFKTFSEDAGLSLTKFDVNQLRELTIQFQEAQLAVQGLFTTIAIGISGNANGPLDPLKAFTDSILKINENFILAQAGTVFFFSFLGSEIIQGINLLKDFWDAVTGKDFNRDAAGPVEALAISFKAAASAEKDFLATRGFRISDPLEVAKGNLLTSLGDTGGGTTYPPGAKPQGEHPGSITEAGKVKDNSDQIKSLIEDFMKSVYEKTRDFNLKMARENQDYDNKRTQEVDEYNRNLLDKWNKFYADQYQRQSAFDQKSYRESVDFSSDQTKRSEDFNRKKSQDEYKFNLSQSDQYADYQTKRRRLIEDSHKQELQDEAQHALERYRLVERENDDLAKLQAKWDEIILRLKIGGDQESINQANAAADLALQKQRDANAAELALFDAKNSDTNSTAEQDLAIKLQRMDEDYAAENERRIRNFELGQQTDQENFNTEQDRREAEFKLKQDRATEDFNLEQTQRDTQFQTEIAQDQEEFDLKIKREDAAQNLKMQRAQEDFDNDIRDMTLKYLARLAELTKEMAWEDEVLRNGYNGHMITRALGEDQATAIAAQGAANRIAIARDEALRIAEFWSSGGYDSSGRRDVGQAPGRAFGGDVPGGLGTPQLILAHGGERIVPPANPNYYNNVRAGDQTSISNTINFTNNVSPNNAQFVINEAKRQLTRDISGRRAVRGAS